MKNIMKLGLVFILVLSMLVVGCGDKDNVSKVDNTTTETKESNADKEDTIEDSKEKVKEEEVEETDTDDGITLELKDVAQKEGVSVKELEKTLDDLAELGGEKYGISKEDYIKQVEESGSSVLEEWSLASEVMGISITELYEAEKASMASKTDEEKEILAGMTAALDEIGAIDLDQIEGEADINELLGITENTSGEIVIAEGEFKDDFYFKADDIDFEYLDEYSITVEYYSNEDIEKILEYYTGLLENTKDYMLLAPYGVPGGMIQGLYNDMSVFVEINDEGDGRTYVACYLDYTSIN